MSTTSRITIEIGKENNVSTYKSVYCHHDGYLSGVGKMLLEYYKDVETAALLITFGDMSCLRKNIYPDSSKPHTFDKPQKDVCVFYCRDKGEDWNDVKPIEIVGKEQDLIKYQEEYNYLFKNGQWYVKKDYKSRFVRLTPEMIEKD